MANKQFGKYKYHITLFLSFSDMEGLGSQTKPAATHKRLQQRAAHRLARCQLTSVPSPSASSACWGCDGLAKCQAAGVAPSSVNEHWSMFSCLFKKKRNRKRKKITWDLPTKSGKGVWSTWGQSPSSASLCVNYGRRPRIVGKAV